MLHEEVPPRIAEILALLEDAELRYVISGSVAAKIHGAEIEPNDLDIVPATDAANLETLVGILRDLEARPAGPFGEWTALDGGEWKWIARPTSDEEVAAWRPNAGDLSSLDNLYRSRLGNFDVVPLITGTYEELKPRAMQIPVYDCEPWVAHVDELLARLTVPRRERDISRVTQLRALQRCCGGMA